MRHNLLKKYLICLLIIGFILTNVYPSLGSLDNIKSFDNNNQLKISSFEDVIVYTAHQTWLSRIYILKLDGSVIDYFEYDFYRFVDLEVVDNQVYVSEAFAPRSYKVNLSSGELDLVIDDWSLFYFYDLAFDDEFFYVVEWDLNRYDINGVKVGTASFDYDVMGSAWDGSYYWTLTDENEIKCWDLSGWPTITSIPENDFTPPSNYCRGLWFDGEYFWTAESIDDTLGYIYQFDYLGTIINQIREPAFNGWSACIIEDFYPNNAPSMPIINGPTEGQAGESYNYSFISTDPDDDELCYFIDWGDESNSSWVGPYESGEEIIISHRWTEEGTYIIKAKTKDVYDEESDWGLLEVEMPVSQNLINSKISFYRSFIKNTMLGMLL